MVQAAATLPQRPEVPHLRELIERLQHPRQQSEPRYLSTGCEALDAKLPGGGIPAGSLVEWLGHGLGCGVSLLPLATLRSVQAEGGLVVVVDRRQNFYPPAAAAWGIDLQNTIVVRPTGDADELWAIDQAVRCRDVAAVLAWPTRLDSYAFRRLQLAAESSGAIGLLVRPPRAVREPTWAHLRMSVAPQPRTWLTGTPEESSAAWQLSVKVLRCRGLAGECQVQLEIDPHSGEIYETHPGHLAPQLAPAAFAEQTA